jgi:hypothetical protein
MSELPVITTRPPELPAPPPNACANCGAELAGDYCAACGQRHEPHVHTIGHFAAEAFESISHADSRLWRTLWLLFSRPGFLSREFFEGKRARYLPPFRLYIVLSVILVLLTSLATGDDAPGATAPAQAPAAAADAVAAPVAELASELAADIQPATSSAAGPAMSAPAADPKWVVNIDGLNQFCAAFESPDSGEGNAEGRENIRRFCTRIRSQPGELAEAVVHSVPRAMFVFLPAIAALMKLLYWRPKRYYVEHLLFLVHNHAAVFLVYTLVALISFIPVLGDLTPLFFFSALGYLGWYVYRAMRTMYGQGRALTILKYITLLYIYLIMAVAGFVITMVLIAIWG